MRENSKYKTIGEVAKILNLIDKKSGSLSTHTIRFWEKQFKQIKPKIFSGNRRYYDENSINLLKKIKYLLKDKGMTLIGVKKVLNSENSDIDEIYNTIFVRPAKALGLLLWKRGDGATIDGTINGIAMGIIPFFTRLAGRAQSGYIFTYAFAMVIGIVVFVSWMTFTGGAK